MFRAAGEHDLYALAELERDANVAGLGHVFPPERYPFPFDATLARWRLALDDPAVAVLVVDDRPTGRSTARLAAYVAYDDAMVHHVAVHPDRWGEGIATSCLRRALRDMGRRGTREATLWVLTENHRARRLYEQLGWRATAETRDAPWPPYPQEVRYRLRILRDGPDRPPLSEDGAEPR